MMNAHVNPPARFLFTTWEGGGNVPPVMTLVADLRRRGHAVRVMSDAVNRPEAEAAGAEFIPWASAPSRPDRTIASDPVCDWEATSPPEGIARLLDRLMTGRSADYARDLLAELKRAPADLVVSSEMLPGVMAGCEAVGQPFALFAANLCLYPLPGMPAFGPGLPPPTTPDELALHDQIRLGTHALLDGGLPALNATREGLGLPPLAHVADQVLAARGYLLGTSRAFDFPVETLPAGLQYVGPQLAEPVWADAWSAPWPEEDRRPLVVIGFSTTFQNHARVLQATIDAAATLPIRALVTLGGVDRDSVIATRNVWLVPSAPHNALMQAASVVVTHGGHGTVMRALRHGRPMLVIPHGRDQAENAVRVASRGAGLMLDASADSAAIADALRRLLEDPAFRDAARRLGQDIVTGDGDAPAVGALESLAGAAVMAGQRR